MKRLSRRRFITLSHSAAWALALPLPSMTLPMLDPITDHEHFDVIIVGGSYSGLAAGMALGRARRRVLIVDGERPCNRHTPYSHNFITQDGTPPHEIAAIARQQVERYPTVEFIKDLVTDVVRADDGFEVRTGSGAVYNAKKVVYAAGIRDVMPAIKGFTECWGKSVLHCPYCHGYEVRNEATGVLGNGDQGFELAKLISNWTDELTLITNGASTLNGEQLAKLAEHRIDITETPIVELEHTGGQLDRVRFADGTTAAIKALYAPVAFEQHSPISKELGCALTEEGYIHVDPSQRTSVHGIYACGDSTTRLRTVANAVATGTTAGMMVNKELINEEF